MTLLILGVALWSFAHLAKRIVPGFHRAMQGSEKPMVSGMLVIAILLMVVGYRSAEVIPLYTPIPGMGHANNLLMLPAIFLFGVGGTKGTLYTRMRHPMLTGTALWSLAHLLVNGDLASLILFGGIGAWAIVAMALINRAGPWQRPRAGRGLKGDLMNLAGTAVLFGLIAWVHIWLGYNPFLGTYP